MREKYVVLFRTLYFGLAFFFAILALFFVDMLRRCVIVDAWTIFPVVFSFAVLSMIAMWSAWRAARRSRLPADFVRPKAQQQVRNDTHPEVRR